MLKIVGAIVIVVGAIKVWFELNVRTQANGGGRVAGALVAVGLVFLLVSLLPGLLPFEIGISVLVVAFVFIYRPDIVVRVSGGPRKEWSALHEGRELAVVVAERGGPKIAAGDAEISARVAGLSAFETPLTSRYLALVRRTILADPDNVSLAGARAELAEADAELRASLGARPVWERPLERRARGEVPIE